jgi:hypothetical protein
LLLSKSYKQFLIAGVFLLVAGFLYHYAFGVLKPEADPKQNYLFKQTRHPLVIWGFQFDGYKQGNKIISIKAVKHHIEKMKVALFRSELFRIVKFKGAEIDIYTKPVESKKKLDSDSQKSNYSLKGKFTKEAMPASHLKNVVSFIFEPVKINFYNGKSLITQIQANKASFKLKGRRFVLKGQVLATSESRSLATDKLTFVPANVLFKTDRHFVLKTSENKVTGNGITTDLSLNPRSILPNTK